MTTYNGENFPLPLLLDRYGNKKYSITRGPQETVSNIEQVGDTYINDNTISSESVYPASPETEILQPHFFNCSAPANDSILATHRDIKIQYNEGDVVIKYILQLHIRGDFEPQDSKK